MYNSFYFYIYLRVKLLFIQFSLLNSFLSWVGIKREIIKMQVLTCICRSGIGLRLCFCICMKTEGDADATWQWIMPWVGMIVVVQSISCVWFFVTPWNAACQFSTLSQNMFKFTSTELVMLSNHLILCCPILLLPSVFPSIKVFSNELLCVLGDQSIGGSASASVLPMNVQGWFPLRLTGLICLQSRELSRVFSGTSIQSIFGTQPSLWSTSHFCIWLP